MILWLVLVAAQSAQMQDFRPVSLGDLVEAVGANRDGLDEVDLDRNAADHAMYLGDGVGVAARLRDDPSGPVFVGWRPAGDVWRYRFLDARELDALRTNAGEGVPLGRLESLRPHGGRYVLETRPTPSTTSSIVMQGDLSPVAQVFGSAKLALPSGALVIATAGIREGARVEDLALLDVTTRRVTPFYAVGPKHLAGSGSSFDVSLSRFQLDERADTLRFTATIASRLPSGIAGPPPVDVAVVCRGISRPTPTCE